MTAPWQSASYGPKGLGWYCTSLFRNGSRLHDGATSGPSSRGVYLPSHIGLARDDYHRIPRTFTDLHTTRQWHRTGARSHGTCQGPRPQGRIVLVHSEKAFFYLLRVRKRHRFGMGAIVRIYARRRISPLTPTPTSDA